MLQMPAAVAPATGPRDGASVRWVPAVEARAGSPLTPSDPRVGPFPDCGMDEEIDELDCVSYPGCE